MRIAEENELSSSLSIYENSISDETQRGLFPIEAVVYYDTDTDVCVCMYAFIKIQKCISDRYKWLHIVRNQTIIVRKYPPLGS